MIYLLDDPGSIGNATTNFLSGDPLKTGAAPRCPACKEPIGSRRWLPPYRVEIDSWGQKFGDIAFGTGDDLFVTERFTSLWQKEGLVGLEGFDPVEIVRIRRRGKTRETPPRYFRVSVVRSEAAVDLVKSGMEWEQPPTCPVCRIGNAKGWSRIVLEAPAVENVFIARGLPGRVLADERFRAFCEEHEIQNAHLIPGPDAGYWY